MRTTWTIILLAACLLALAGPALAEQEITGTYRVSEGGQVIGAERYSLTIGDDGQVQSESQGSTKRDESVIQEYTRLTMREIGGPVQAYQREVVVNRLPSGLAATYNNGELLIELREGAKKRERRMNISGTTLPLDVGVWHHYHFLIHRYAMRQGGEQQFTVVVPSELRIIDQVRVTRLGYEAVALPNGYFMAHRYFIDRGDMGVTVWADKRGQIIKIDVPMLTMTIEAEKYNGERAAEANPVQTIGGDLTAEKATVVSSGQVELNGVITKPRGLAGRLPALLFLSPAGPQDRDGNALTAPVNIGTQTMMDGISKRGFLVLRLDDRGVGESQGDVARTALSIEVQDAEAAIAFLQKRPDVDPARIGIVGHGEGANVALMVAAKRNDLKALVLLAPSDVPFSDLAVEQIKHRLKLEGNTDPEAWRANPVAQVMDQARRQPNLQFTMLGGKPVYLQVYREWFNMKPLDDVKKVQAKILHVQGGLDLQVFPQHAEGFQRVLQGAANYTFKLFPKLNHFFKPSRGSLAEYSDPNLKVDPEFIKYVSDWLRASL